MIHPSSDVPASSDLVVARPEGLYCPPGDFYIDPWRPVERAVITHAHARPCARGPRHYLAHADSAGMLRTRLGEIALQTLAYGEAHRPQRRAAVAASGRPRARLGAGAARAWRARVGRVGRLQDRARRHLRALRAGALRHLHHRVDFRPADLSLADAGGAVRRDQRLVARATPQQGARVGAASATRSARRSASCAAWTPRSARSSCTARSSR